LKACYEIISISDEPCIAGATLDVDFLKPDIRLAQERYDVALDRESVVSALTKKVRKGEIFVRTAPNTYGLKD